MKILNLEQRSDEWLHFREGKISGSKAKEFGTPRTILKAEWLELAKNLGVEIPLNQKGEPKNLTIQELKDLIGETEVQKKECEVELGDAIYKLIAERIAKPLNENDYADRLDGRKYSSAVRGEILEVEAREKLAKKLNKEIIEGRVWQADFNENIICSPDGEITNENGEIVANKHYQEQAEMLKRLRAANYYAEFAIGYDDAIQQIKEYLGEPKRKE